jgi:pimeloyl-ACP methyl ester carboxylesterase
MKILRTLALAAMVALPLQAAQADETVTDWKGKKITLQEGTVDNNGVKIHYYTVGKGPFLFISHGNGHNWFHWRNQLALLSQKYQVVLYDLRAFNKSDKPAGVENYTHGKLVSDLLAVQNHFTKEPAIHIGHDQGGMVLWSYAMNHPDKVRLLIQTNAIHPRAFIRELSRNPEQVKASWYIQQTIDHRTTKALEWERGVMNPTRVRPGETDEDRRMRAEAFQRMGDAGLQGVVDWYSVNFPSAPFSPHLRGFDSWGTNFPNIKAPTLVIVALNDGALHPGGYDDISRWFDNEFRLVTWHKAGHSHHLDQPERFNRAISNWLNYYDTTGPRLK